MTDFSSKFKNLADLQLFEIAEINMDDHSAESVLAAKKEFESRNLTLEEINELRLQIEDRANQKENRFKLKSLKNKIPKFEQSIDSADLADSDVLDTEFIPSTNRLRIYYIISIILVSIFFLIVLGSLYTLFSFGTLEWGIESIFYFLTQLGILVGLPLYIFKRKGGWIILNLSLSSMLVLRSSIIFSIVRLINNPDYASFYYQQYYTVQDTFLIFLVPVLIWGLLLTTLITLHRKILREAYSINSNTRWLSVFGLTVPITIILLRMFFL